MFNLPATVLMEGMRGFSSQYGYADHASAAKVMAGDPPVDPFTLAAKMVEENQPDEVKANLQKLRDEKEKENAAADIEKEKKLATQDLKAAQRPTDGPDFSIDKMYKPKSKSALAKAEKRLKEGDAFGNKLAALRGEDLSAYINQTDDGSRTAEGKEFQDGIMTRAKDSAHRPFHRNPKEDKADPSQNAAYSLAGKGVLAAINPPLNDERRLEGDQFQKDIYAFGGTGAEYQKPPPSKEALTEQIDHRQKMVDAHEKRLEAIGNSGPHGQVNRDLLAREQEKLRLLIKQKDQTISDQEASDADRQSAIDVKMSASEEINRLSMISGSPATGPAYATPKTEQQPQAHGQNSEGTQANLKAQRAKIAEAVKQLDKTISDPKSSTAAKKAAIKQKKALNEEGKRLARIASSKAKLENDELVWGPEGGVPVKEAAPRPEPTGAGLLARPEQESTARYKNKPTGAGILAKPTSINAPEKEPTGAGVLARPEATVQRNALVWGTNGKELPVEKPEPTGAGLLAQPDQKPLVLAPETNQAPTKSKRQRELVKKLKDTKSALEQAKKYGGGTQKFEKEIESLQAQLDGGARPVQEIKDALKLVDGKIKAAAGYAPEALMAKFQAEKAELEKQLVPKGDDALTEKTVEEFVKNAMRQEQNIADEHKEALTNARYKALTSPNMANYKPSTVAATYMRYMAITGNPINQKVMANFLAGDNARGDALAFMQMQATQANSMRSASTSVRKGLAANEKKYQDAIKTWAKSYSEEQLQKMGFVNAEDFETNVMVMIGQNGALLHKAGIPVNKGLWTDNDFARVHDALERTLSSHGTKFGSLNLLFFRLGGKILDQHGRLSKGVLAHLTGDSLKLSALQKYDPSAYEAIVTKYGNGDPDKALEAMYLESVGITP